MTLPETYRVITMPVGDSGYSGVAVQRTTNPHVTDFRGLGIYVEHAKALAVATKLAAALREAGVTVQEENLNA